MTIYFSLSDVRLMIRILTRSVRQTDALAVKTGEDSWELEDMAWGRTMPTAPVVRYLGLERRGKRFLWRCE